ncbi:MAG: PQQ-dependent sugar dehydrogenase [Pseudomonadota bacterium]
MTGPLPDRRALLGGGTAALFLAPARPAPADVIGADGLRLQRSLVSDRLKPGAALGFLPRGAVMVAERSGSLAVVRPEERITRLSGAPRPFRGPGGGFRALHLPPQINRQRFLILAYVDEFALSQARLMLSRFAYDPFGERLSEENRLWIENPPHSSTARVSGALTPLGDRTVFVALGDRGDRGSAFDATLASGKIYRLREDGGTALINPLLGTKSRPGIWSMGHADPIALALRPSDASLWCLDRDDGTAWLTRVLAGLRHTAPDEAGFEPQEGALPFVRPAHVWDADLGPTAMRFVEGARFTAWQDRLLLGTRKGLRLIALEAGRVVGETVIPGEFGRIADLRFGPDGALWVLGNRRREGLLWRLAPI